MADFREDRRSRALPARLADWLTALSLLRGALHRVILVVATATRFARSSRSLSSRVCARARARDTPTGQRFENPVRGRLDGTARPCATHARYVRPPRVNARISTDREDGARDNDDDDDDGFAAPAARGARGESGSIDNRSVRTSRRRRRRRTSPS